MAASGVSMSVGNVIPKIRLSLKILSGFELRSDLFERADTVVNRYGYRWIDHPDQLVPTQQNIAK